MNQFLNTTSGITILLAFFRMALGSTILLFLVYCFLLLLGYFWNGLRRFFRIFFLPGMIVHIVGHFLTARWLNKVHKLTGFGVKARNEWSYSIIRTTTTKEACAVALAPICLSIPLAFYFRYLFFLTYGNISLFFGWLALSLFVEGLPSTHDFQLVFLKHVEDKPYAYILFPWTGIVGVLAYLLYPQFAVLIALTYFISISLIFLWPSHSSSSRSQEKEEVII